jgi:hypothetical protein
VVSLHKQHIVRCKDRLLLEVGDKGQERERYAPLSQEALVWMERWIGARDRLVESPWFFTTFWAKLFEELYELIELQRGIDETLTDTEIVDTLADFVAAALDAFGTRPDGSFDFALRYRFDEHMVRGLRERLNREQGEPDA